MIRRIDVKSPKRVERIFFETVFVANLVGAAGVDVDRSLGEECQHAADVGDNPVDLRKALQHPAINQPRHGHGAVESPAEDQCRHDVDAGRFRRQRRGRMDINRQLVFRQPLVNRKQFFAVKSLTVEIGKAAETAQSKLVNRAFQLIKRRFDITSRQRERSR